MPHGPQVTRIPSETGSSPAAETIPRNLRTVKVRQSGLSSGLKALQQVREVSSEATRRRLVFGIAVGELGVFLDSITTPIVVEQFGLRLEANPLSSLVLDTGTYLLANVGFMLFLFLLSYMLYRWATPSTMTTAAWGFLLLGLFRGFFGLNNLLILSGLHPLI